MGIEHNNINNMILMSEELFDRNREIAGHVWSYFPSLHSELSQAICQPDLVEPDLEFEANDFIHHAALMEININKSYSTQSDKLVIFNLLDSMLALDMNITDLIILAGRLKKCGLKIILSIQPTKKMANACCHKSVLNASRLFDKGIDFCLRNYNPKNDIQVMMLRCGFVSHVEIDLQCSHALENYFVDKLDTNNTTLILSGVDSTELDGVARSFPAKLFKGSVYSRKRFY